MKVKFGFAESAVAAIFAVALGAAGVSSAATVNATVDFNDGVTSGGSIKTYVEDGFQFYDARIVGGPCEFGGADKCAALNPHEVTVLTKVGGGAFDFSSIWFYLNGKVSDGTNALAIYETTNTLNRYDFTQPAYSHNTGYTALLNFTNVTSITFVSGGTCIPNKPGGKCTDKGNARFDTAMLSYDTPRVPLPAGGLLLVSGLGALAAMRRRKSI